jgi:hypothetical protein
MTDGTWVATAFEPQKLAPSRETARSPYDPVQLQTVIDRLEAAHRAATALTGAVVSSHLRKTAIGAALFMLMLLAGCSDGSTLPKEVADAFPLGYTNPQRNPTKLMEVYSDNSHCLSPQDSEGGLDVSCMCRDAIADARYVYFGPFQHDQNLVRIYQALEDRIRQPSICGTDLYSNVAKGVAFTQAVVMDPTWKWSGPIRVR